jgi:hypothetical protein
MHFYHSFHGLALVPWFHSFQALSPTVSLIPSFITYHADQPRILKNDYQALRISVRISTIAQDFHVVVDRVKKSLRYDRGLVMVLGWSLEQSGTFPQSQDFLVFS